MEMHYNLNNLVNFFKFFLCIIEKVLKTGLLFVRQCSFNSIGEYFTLWLSD